MNTTRHAMAHTAFRLLFCVISACASDGDDTPVDRKESSDTTVDRNESVTAGELKPDERCLSQCELASGNCDTIPFEAFPNFAATSLDWMKLCPMQLSSAKFPFFVAAKCEDGTQMLYRGTGKTTERRYFETTGEFVALTTRTDSSKDECGGVGFWPKLVSCDRPVVVESFCGSYAAGQILE